MNAPSPVTPCERYEHEIADLVDGLLDEVDASRVRAHLAGCAPCRSWAAEYSALSDRLASGLPQPTLSPAFDAALAARIDALKSANGREARRAAADAEYDALLRGLKRHTGRSALFGALASATAVGGAWIALHRLLAQGTAAQALLQGTDRVLVFGTLGAGIAVTVIAWTLSRSAIALPRFARW